LAATILGALGVVAVVQATRAQAEVSVNPERLELAGEPGAETSGVVTLVSADDRLIASFVVDRPTDGANAIPPEVVKITPDRVDLEPGLPQAVRISLVLPDEAGTYTSTVTLTFVDDPDATDQEPVQASRTLELIATVGQAPAPSPELALVGSLKATRVACEADCALADILLPPAERLPEISIAVQNTGSVDATLEQGAVLAFGDRTGVQLTGDALSLHSAEPIPAGQLRPLTFAVGDGLRPDRYVGQMALAVDGLTKPLTAGVELTVRQGPFWPVVFLGAGFVAGLLVRRYRKVWLPRADAYERLQGMRRTVGGLLLLEDERDMLQGRLNIAEADLAAGKTDDASKALDTIGAALRLLGLLIDLLVALGNRTDDGAKSARALITDGRQALIIGKADGSGPDFPKAAQSYERAMASAITPEAPADRQFAEEAGWTAPKIDVHGIELPHQPTPGPPTGLLRVFSALRAPVMIVLWFLALAAGVLALYVAPPTGFIGNTYADVAGLLFWGFGSGWVDKVFVDWG
jgi:hypothetical protein